MWESLHIPPQASYRLKADFVYYLEYRSNCGANVKVYFQRKAIIYADYTIDYTYISPFDLYLGDGTAIIEPLRRAPDSDALLFAV